MTAVTRSMDAPPERVFAAMTDAWLFPVWVVGATHIRDVDEDWPAVGARLHHQIGAWPFAVSNSTAILEHDAPNRLVLQARIWPFGEARVELAVRQEGSGSSVRMAEAVARGIVAVLDNPLQRKLLTARNRESLDRLAAIAENRRDSSVRDQR